MMNRLERSLRDRESMCHRALLAGVTAHPCVEHYRLYLCDVYGFTLETEQALWKTPVLSIEFMLPRIRSGRIAADLLALGITPLELERLARRAPTPVFEYPVDALGWIYVNDRLTLHHEALRHRLSLFLPEQLATADAYLTTHANVEEERWRDLANEIDRWTTATQVHRLVRAASDAMQCLEDWLGGAVRATATLQKCV